MIISDTVKVLPSYVVVFEAELAWTRGFAAGEITVWEDDMDDFGIDYVVGFRTNGSLIEQLYRGQDKAKAVAAAESAIKSRERSVELGSTGQGGVQLQSVTPTKVTVPLEPELIDYVVEIVFDCDGERDLVNLPLSVVNLAEAVIVGAQITSHWLECYCDDLKVISITTKLRA